MHSPSHAHHAPAVVAHGSQYAGYQRPVAIIVVGKVRPGKRVEAVPAIVRIHPHVRSEVFVRVTHPGIQLCHHNVACGGQHIPAFRRVDVRKDQGVDSEEELSV